MRFVTMLLVCALGLSAADLSGKWTGRLDTGKKGGPFWLTLKQSGPALTGTGGLHETGQEPIQNAKAAGDKVTLEIPITMPNGLRAVCRFELTAKGDGLEGAGEVPNEHGGTMPVTVTLKRVPK